MVAGETAVDDTESGYVTDESISLSAFPAGSSYSWGLSAPTASAVARSSLSSTTSATPTFTPDVAGYYVIDCNVDGTAYLLRIAVVATSPVAINGAINLPPVADASVPPPATGRTVYNSVDQDSLAFKDAAGDIYTFDVTGPV
jgi:hypothetical protein